MKTLIVNQKEVAGVLPMKECIKVMEQVFTSLSNNETIQPLRMVMKTPDNSLLGLMPSYIDDIKSIGTKIITVFPSNHGTKYDAHQGVVLLYEAEHGCLQAIVDATAITGIRTAAVSAVATKLLAPANAHSLAILGAGTQAQAHLEAMSLVRDIKEVRVWSIYHDEALKFASRETQRLGLNVQAADTAEEAVSNADLICTTTPAKEPILMGKWIKPGTHINAIGACSANARELDTEAVVKSRLYVDRKESTLNEAGDFIIPKQEGTIDDTHILGEIGDILTGKIKGRQSSGEITLFKALGLAIQDLASAHYIYHKAKESGIGIEVEIGGEHFAKDV